MIPISSQENHIKKDQYDLLYASFVASNRRRSSDSLYVSFWGLSEGLRKKIALQRKFLINFSTIWISCNLYSFNLRGDIFLRIWKVWYGLVWDHINLKLVWKFHQDPTCIGCFREDLELVYFGMVWYGLVLLETTSVWSFCKSFIKIQLVLAVLEKI